MKLFLSFLLSVICTAQNTYLLDKFSERVSKSCVEVTYSYSARVSGVNNIGQGVLAAQGLAWTMTGNGVEMYCDSVTLWVIDPSLKEVVIERAASDSEVQYLTNPAIMLVHLRDLFVVRESRDTDDGKAVLFILEPKAKEGIEYFNVEIQKKDALVRSASFAMKDGTAVNIEVSSMKLTPLRPIGEFRPRNSQFDSSWIVTDLR